MNSSDLQKIVNQVCGVIAYAATLLAVAWVITSLWGR